MDEKDDTNDTIIIPSEDAPVIVRKFKTNNMSVKDLTTPQIVTSQDTGSFIADIFDKINRKEK